MFIERILGLGEEGHVTRRCTFNFNVDLSFLVAVMADSSTGHRSYRSSPNWNREDIVLPNARIYTLGLTACVRISATGFSLWGVSRYGYQKCKFLFVCCIGQKVMASLREMHTYCGGKSINCQNIFRKP